MPSSGGVDDSSRNVSALREDASWAGCLLPRQGIVTVEHLREPEIPNFKAVANIGCVL